MLVAPCKWPGGKRKIAPTVVASFRSSFPAVRYVEPYLGMGSVMLAVLHDYPLLPVVAADVDPGVVSLWRTVQAVPTEVHRALSVLAHYQDAESFYFLRDEQNARNVTGAVDIPHAATMIYLSKLAFGGTFRRNASGGLNMPHGDKLVFTCPPVNYFELLAQTVARVEFHLADGISLINGARAGDWIFADPPYVGAHAYGVKRWTLDNADRLVSSLNAAVDRGAAAVFCEHDKPEIRALLTGWQIDEWAPPQNIRTHKGQVGKRERRLEIIATRRKLNI